MEALDARVREHGGGARARPAACRAAARIAHLLVLRHAFAPAVFERLAAPWIGDYIDRPGTPQATVRRRHV